MHLKIARYAQCALKSGGKCNLEIVALFASMTKITPLELLRSEKKSKKHIYTHCTLFLQHLSIFRALWYKVSYVDCRYTIM